ncbi:MAG: hypothetical protein JW779_01910 [Candidatus Thorarchaeota archaeon]|nr:hypothetical protein [Candidatus Thorarchaeota archaeon]
MMPGMIPEDEAGRANIPYRYVGILAVLIAIGGIIIAWLGGQGILPINPGVALGMSILLATILVCCAAAILQGTFASRIADYGDMEIRYDEAMEHFENEEWENALLIFTELAGPKMDHKRGTFYAAVCYEKLNDWENVKKYIKAYLTLKKDDAEAWEILARAERSMFEYEASEEALDRAARIRGN